MANDGLTMPHSTDAESALLACVLIDNELQTSVLETLREEDFYLEAHKYLFRGMRRVFENKQPVDIITLSDELEKCGELEKAGGIAYITEITQFVPSSANYKSYLEIVKRNSTNRRLIRASKRIIENSMKDVDASSALQFAEKQIYDLSREAENKSLKGMAEDDVVMQVIGRFEEIAQDPSVVRGVETGFRQLDMLTKGLQKSDLIILAARPGMGKTSFAMNIVEHAAMQKKKICAVFSLEMPRIQIVQRLLCSYAGVSMEKALSGKLEDKDYRLFYQAADSLTKSKIYIDDSSKIMPSEMLSKCRRLSAQVGGLDLVMVDYIQLMGSINGEGGDGNRQNEVATISRELKLMAKELDVPVIALSQLRRIQTKEPTLSDLRESGAIEQDADIVMFINRPEATATKEDLKNGTVVKGAADLIIAKHRNGSTGRIPLHFRSECTKFINVEDQNRNDLPPEERRHEQSAEKESAEEEFPPVDENDPQNAPRKGDLKTVGNEDLPF